MTEFLNVITTIDDYEKAKNLGRIIVEKKIAACCQISNEIESIYTWKDKIEEAKEYRLSFKTNRKNERDLINEIKKKSFL